MGEICKDYGSVIENRFEAMEKAVKKDIKYCLGVFTECRVLSVFSCRACRTLISLALFDGDKWFSFLRQLE